MVRDRWLHENLISWSEIYTILHYELRSLKVNKTRCHSEVNPLSANLTKWSNTLKHFVGILPTNCLSVFDHFVALALKGLNFHCVKSVQIRSFLWLVFSCIQSEYRKVRTRKNSVFGHFSRSVQWQSPIPTD